MEVADRWRKECGARLQGSRLLDNSKLQAPCVVRMSDGFRLFYTAVGPAKPFSACQGYILSAVSDDGLAFRPDPGIRLAPDPGVSYRSLRLLAPTLIMLEDGRWRMYVEARGSANQPRVICSAVSSDMLYWDFEEGIRLQSSCNLGAPRYAQLPGGLGRLYCCASGFGFEGPQAGEGPCQGVVSAITSDGLRFTFERGWRLLSKQGEYDTAGISAAEVIPPAAVGEEWTMFFSAWQDVPQGTAVPMHPSQDPDAMENGLSENFAAASIASDMAGYRSRIFMARSPEGLAWGRTQCVVEGAGYGGDGLDAVHAEDMSLMKIGGDAYRMYYAACDKNGIWRIASAVTE